MSSSACFSCMYVFILDGGSECIILHTFGMFIPIPKATVANTIHSLPVLEDKDVKIELFNCGVLHAVNIFEESKPSYIGIANRICVFFSNSVFQKKVQVTTVKIL